MMSPNNIGGFSYRRGRSLVRVSAWLTSTPPLGARACVDYVEIYDAPDGWIDYARLHKDFFSEAKYRLKTGDQSFG